MTLNFPTSPTVGLQTSIADKIWEYDGKGWKLLPNSSVLATERIKALDNSSSTTLYPVMVDQIGISTSIFAGQTRSLVYNASTGNLGIGTTNASSKLTVSGDVSATGGYNLNIQSSGVTVTTGVITAINFTGATASYNLSTKTATVTVQTTPELDITSSLFI